MRALKIALGVIAGLALLLIAAALLVAYRFDPNDYKRYATDAFAARTGRTLALEDDLSLTFFPWLAVQAGGIAVGNAPGFGSEPFATVERAAVRVKVLPLLTRRIEIGTVELDGLVLNLARDDARRGNWQDLLDLAQRGTSDDAAAGGGQAVEPSGRSATDDRPAANDAAPADPASAAALPDLELAGVRVTGGRVNWRENVTDLRYTVAGLDITTGAIRPGAPVDFELAANVRDQALARGARLSVAASAELGADGAIAARGMRLHAVLEDSARPAPVTLTAQSNAVTYDPAAQALDVDDLTADANGVPVRLDVRGTSLLEAPAFEGTLSAADAPIAAALALAGAAPPPGVDPASLGNASVSAAFRVRAAPLEVTVSNIEARALGMTARADATLDAENNLTGRIDIPAFAPNDAFFALVRPAAGAVDLTAIEELALALGFDANLATGSLAVHDARASALGATIAMSLEVEPGPPGERGGVYRGTFQTSRFSPAPAARVFGNLLPETLAVEKLGTVALDTAFTYDRAKDTFVLTPLGVELFGLTITGRVAGSQLSWSPSYSGEARVAEFSPQALLTRFGLPPQPTSDPLALTKAELATRFTIAETSAKLEGLSLKLDDSTITGDFTLASFADPQYVFTLAVDAVDADRYLPPKARDADQGEATAGDLELPQNNTMNMDGRMTIGSLTLAGMRFADVGARVVLGGGNAVLENARARLYGGEFNGNFRVNAAGDTPGLALDGRAAGVELAPLIEALTGEPANVSGTGSFDLALAGTGRKVIDNVGTANGNVSFELADGAIQGFNLGRTLCAAYNLTQRAPAPPEQPKVTPYQGIKGTASVANGQASSHDLLARTSFMDINGAGTLALVDQHLDYRLDAKLTAPIGIPGCETLDPHVGNALPFNIRGTVTEPTITPDFSKLVQRALRNEIQERLEDRLRDLLR